MATATLPKRMTIEEFLALPDDGVDRELINGELREKGTTIRSRLHSQAMASISCLVSNWAKASCESLFKVLCGEAGFILDRSPSLIVGVDVAITAREPRSNRESPTTLVEGPPYVAIEILSPSDSHGDVHEKLRLYLDHGVAAVWIVDPDDQSVRIYRSGCPVAFSSGDDMLTCEPEMPGFAVKASSLFE